MKTLQVYIEYKPIYNRSCLYVWNDDYFFTIVDGVITANKQTDECVSESKPLFEGPRDIISAIANALMDQHNKGDLLKTEGKSVRMLDEITWLREIIKAQIK